MIRSYIIKHAAHPVLHHHTYVDKVRQRTKYSICISMFNVAVYFGRRYHTPTCLRPIYHIQDFARDQKGATKKSQRKYFCQRAPPPRCWYTGETGYWYCPQREACF